MKFLISKLSDFQVFLKNNFFYLYYKKFKTKTTTCIEFGTV